MSYELSWGDNMKIFLETISFIAKSSEIILSIDCFLRDNNITTHPLFIKMVVITLFPLGCILLICIVWGILFTLKKNINAQMNLIVSIIIIIFITLPPITSITMTLFNCVDIFEDSNSYLAIDISI